MSNIEKVDLQTVAHVHEHLRSPIFHNNLYWEILSALKEKHIFKSIRGSVEKIINQSMEEYSKLNNSEVDNMRKKAIIVEICTMSYTVDGVFSKILYMNLEKAYREHTINILKELENEGKIPEGFWPKFRLQNEAPKAGTSAENSEVKTVQVHQKSAVRKPPVRVTKRKQRVVSNSFLKNIQAPTSKKEILEDLKRVKEMEMNNVEQDDSTNKKGRASQKKLGEGTKDFSKIVSGPVASTSFQKLTKENVSLWNSLDQISKDSIRFMAEDSLEYIDVSESEFGISVGHVSDESVSSVHTSDLSSYDDEISLSSDDETGKKKTIPLKEVLKLFNKKDKGKDVGKKDIQISKVPESRVSVHDNTDKDTSGAASSPTLNENGLLKRVRKPNSRYSSDNMLCAAVKVKERKKSASHMTNASEKVPSSDELSPQKKKPKPDNDIMGDVATITQSIINNERSCYVTPPKKQLETPDMPKSFSANRSLTSRRTAPVTLFST